MKQGEIVIDFNDTGTVEGLHHDEFDLKFLGRKIVGRASEIFHDADSDTWYVLLPHQVEMGDSYSAARGFVSYDQARRFEVVWLNECRKRGFRTDIHNNDVGVVACEMRGPFQQNENRKT